MTPYLILLGILAGCLISAGLYIRWDYLQDRKDVWDWPEAEASESTDTDWEAYSDDRVGVPAPPSRLEAALAAADDAIRESDIRPEPTQREIHWQAPGTRRIKRGVTVLTDAVAVVITRVTAEPADLHWRAA